jgi:capsular polysaccharide export protein
MIGVFSGGLYRIPHLEAFLGDAVRLRPSGPGGLNGVAGWGHKPTADKARQRAGEWRLPYFAVEDGFLRSLGLGVLGHPPLSLVVDDLGIYYDATGPSRLERLIAEGGFSPEELALAGEAIRAVRRERLSKYNHAPDLDPGALPSAGGKRVLLVDQTRNDASVRLGRADESSFRAMAEAAAARPPGAALLVKVHPDVTAGKKRGYLAEMGIPGSVLLDFDVNPLSLLEHVDSVYTVTSQMGFEALLAGCEVSCFGMPFYAGWGLTRDALREERRGVARSLEEVFAAAYLRYARYVNPYTDRPCGILEAIDVLADQKRHNDRNRGRFVCAGFSWWRRGFAKHFFASTDGEVAFVRSGKAAAKAARKAGSRVLVWSAKVPEGTFEACREAGVDVVGVEDGFLRSSGLGSDFHYPYSLCVDTRGAYFDPSRPSDLETLLRDTAFDPRLLERAARLRESIVGRGVTKYNVGARGEVRLDSGGRPTVLVVGQVQGDKSVELGGLGMRSDRELLRAVREKRPGAFVVYKPHPDVVSGNRPGGAFAEEDRALYDLTLTDVSLDSLFSAVDELHTLTSLSGFEALLRGLPVVTYGGPFYAGWGLTEDRVRLDRRGRSLSLDELVAGVLILYPSYYDWRTEMFCGPEVVLERLTESAEPRQGAFRRRVSRFVQTILKSVS